MGSPAVPTQGPAFIGIMCNVLLYGIMVMQTFAYYKTYKKDPLWIRIFVAVLFVADTVNSVLNWVWIYTTLIVNFDDTDALLSADWLFATDPALTAIIALLVQFFFAWRVKVLTSNNWAVLAVAFCSICQFLGGLGTAIAVGIIPEFMRFHKFQVIVVIWLVFSAICDALITLILSLYLRRHKTGFVATDAFVDRVIRMTVQTGMITAIIAISDLIAFLTSSSGLHLAFNFPLGKLYTNTLMSTLNSRQGWKFGQSSGGQNNIALQDMPNSVNRRTDFHTASGILVHIQTSKIVDGALDDASAANHKSVNTSGASPFSTPAPGKSGWLQDASAV